MIGKAASIGHTGSSINYAMKGEELDRRGIVGESAAEIKQDFEIISNQNKNCENNTISMVLSPQPLDGEALNNQQLKAITRDYLKEMKLNDRQFVSYVHTDKNHKHIHIYANRINAKGEAYNDSFIGKKSQNAADKVAQEHGLTRAKLVERGITHEQQKIGLTVSQDKEKIKSIHNDVMKEKPKNFDHYSQMMEKKGVHIKPHIKKNTKEIAGFRLGLSKDNMIKASEISRKGMKMVELTKQFGLNMNPATLAMNIASKAFKPNKGHDISR